MSTNDYRDHRFNYRMGVLNGTIFMFGVAFMHPTTIVPNFLYALGESKVLIGLFGVAHNGGWYLPQILAAGLIERFRKKKILYLLGNGGRMAFTGAALMAIFTLGTDHPKIGISLFLVLYTLGLLGGGVAGLCFNEMVGDLIPPHRRGAFFSVRFLLGGSILTILTGFIVREVLARPETFPFPTNYALLFGLGWLMMVLGTLAFALVREAPSEVMPQPRPILAAFYQAFPLLRSDEVLRKLILSRFLATASQMSWPFFILFAREELKLEASTVGTFLIVQTAGGLLGNLCWGTLSVRRGNRFILQLCSAMELAAPLYATVVGSLLAANAASWEARDLVLGLSPVFFLIGVTGYGSYVGSMSYLLDVAPEESRPTYLGVFCSAMGIATLTPLLGGYMAKWLGLRWVFLFSALCALMAFGASMRLKDKEG